MPANESSRSDRLSKIWGNLIQRLPLYLVAIYQLMAIFAIAVVVITALSYFRTPFIGSMVEHTLVINANQATRPGSWHAKNQGLDFGHQILAVNGQPVGSLQDFNQLLSTYQVGQEIELAGRDHAGELFTASIELQSFPRLDRFAQMVVPLVIGLFFLGSGLWVLAIRRNDSTGQVFATFAASVAIAVSGLFNTGTTGELTTLWTFSLALTGGTLLHLGLIFPQQVVWVRQRPYISWLSYVPGLGLFLWAWPTLFNYERPFAYVLPWRFEYIFMGLAALFFVGMSAYRRYTAQSPNTRQQARILLWAAVLAFGPVTAWFFITSGRPEANFSTLLFIPLALFPLFTAYAILRYRLLNTDYILSRAVLYALLSILAISGYAILVAGLSLILGSRLPANSPWLIGAMVFLLAVLLNPLRIHLQRLVDMIFFRGQQAYREHVQSFSQELNPAMDLQSIVNLLRRYVQQSLLPLQQHIFIWDGLREHFVAAPDENDKVTTDLTFSSQSALPQLLSRRSAYLFLGEEGRLQPALQPDKARFALLGAQLFVPLPGTNERVTGFIALAPRRSGEPYTELDLNLLTSLADQAAIAVQRAQVVADLERRVTEMNVLIRIGQGINVTVQFDDILELIYAQTNRLIPTFDFWIQLYDREYDIFQYVFYLEDDRRMLERENQPVLGEKGLSQAVIRNGRLIVTDDYERECRNIGVLPLVEGIYAWVGVPLNAGAQTIGSLSLASRDPADVYSANEVSLLQAIADQAAGAIVKSRLLEASERNARQLALLNEIGRGMTSTLDLPSLLNQILDNAMEILNTEAGTLFLVDEDNGELVFEVVVGPVAEELVGRRLAPGTGHVGRSVETGKPAIVNQVRRTLEWSEKPDAQTGFQTRDLLLVPLFVKDRVVGVIEVINKRNGMPFTTDDQGLLMTFASQAAVALENARLYTLTDQQLAERVDELSVMQRIDRELNASLDVNRAMRITLDWAMRQSGADAGLVGAVVQEPSGIRVIADQGYSHELDAYRDELLPLELPGLRSAVEVEQTQQFSRAMLTEPDQNAGFSLLSGANAQIVIPIRREEAVIGVLMLESRRDEPWREDSQAFLSRLTDHAAIAIANAQLFAQVQAADLAKSEFVSFVSHELKTPMTSIRGYTDLLIGGAVGPINENQENFLGTIRANVNRMATLVSDLADVSRIEAGRLRLEFQAVNVAGVVDEVARSLRRDLDEKEQNLVQDLGADLPPVWADRTRLVQVLTNLVSNAHKYTQAKGTITIEARAEPNRWDPAGAQQVVRIAVRDNGIGLKTEDQTQIFTKFFRSDDPKARESPGTGLGLNITRYLVEMQGGQIWFESVYREGTTFHFIVPVAEV